MNDSTNKQTIAALIIKLGCLFVSFLPSRIALASTWKRAQNVPRNIAALKSSLLLPAKPTQLNSTQPNYCQISTKLLQMSIAFRLFLRICLWQNKQACNKQIFCNLSVFHVLSFRPQTSARASGSASRVSWHLELFPAQLVALTLNTHKTSY